MQRLLSAQPEAPDQDYRSIEQTLLQSARGRWFLSEHGRRARRLDSKLLDDAVARLQMSLRQPPALLGQLQSEIAELKVFLSQTRAAILARPSASGSSQMLDGAIQPQAILKAAEDIHDIAWSLQANPFNPAGCEQIARSAAKLYALSQTQAVESDRALSTASALDEASRRLEAILETVVHELQIDQPPVS